MTKAEIAEEEQYRKMTETPIPRLIGTLAVPTIISMMISNIYNTADTYFVSRLGTSASGAVGITVSLMAVFQAIGFMCGHGAGSFVSRKLGEQKPDEARIFSSSSFFMSIFLGTAISVLGLIFIDPLMYAMGSTDTILPYAKQYAVWILFAGPFLTSSCVMNNILRYEGKAFYAMIGLTTGGVLNMVGDPILMFGLGMGVSGAGLSTALSQVVSFLILLHMYRSGKTVTTLKWKDISKKVRIYTGILTVGFPSFVRQMMNSLSTVVLNHQAKPYGDAAIAAMSIVGRIALFIVAVAIGMGQGMQPVVGFNYGAGKYSRMKKAYWFTSVAGTILLGGIALLVLFHAETIVEWFRDDPEVIVVGTQALRYQCVSCLVMAFSFTSNMIFQSIGKAGRATFLAMLRSGLFFIPLILILPHFFGITGIEIAQPLADLVSVAVSVPFAVAFLHSLPKSGVERS